MASRFTLRFPVTIFVNVLKGVQLRGANGVRVSMAALPENDQRATLAARDHPGIGMAPGLLCNTQVFSLRQGISREPSKLAFGLERTGVSGKASGEEVKIRAAIFEAHAL
ncbi:hypothetical protein KIL84_019758 [Mauremys mutica]|uniref:Uncharacterized protein n=1 Tax=Mauremys mutica TaxID=74926 RepID=A0A9D3XUE2_9SAUR|nr:hypothetical protein KIL84_019758 [Mauremys mutica]